MNRLRSFTLIEMLIALALIIAMVFVLLPTASRIMTSTTAAADRNHRLAQLALFSDLLDRAMLTAIAQDASGRQAFTGEESVLRLAACGVSLVPRDPGAPDDIQTMEFAFNGDSLTLRQGNSGREVILTGIEKGAFAYSSGQGWAGSFDGSGGMPGAVAVSIWLRRGDIELTTEEAGESEEVGQEEREPDWRRVFAVFDPESGSEAEMGGGV